MKTMFRLITTLVLITLTVAIVFSYIQASQEKVRLNAELEKKASVLADSLKLTVEPFLTIEKTTYLQRIMDRFSNREKLVGVEIHDIRNNLIVSSTGLSNKLNENTEVLKENIQEVERLKNEQGSFAYFGKTQLYLYSVPLMTEDVISHVLTTYYDAGYIQERVSRIWMNSFLRAFIQALLISVTTFIIILLNVMIPIKKATFWIKKIRQGDQEQVIETKQEFFLKPLLIEISKMAQSLQSARAAAEEEARLRYSAESLWTPERLKEAIRLKLGTRTLFVVSNREPYMHIQNGKDIECIVPASGLVTAIEPVLNACGGMWIAQGSGNADRLTVDEHDRIKVPPEEPRYTLRRVWVEKELEDGFYSGFSNEGLWPLCHIAHTRPTFRNEDWIAYQKVNERFSKVVLEEIENVSEPFVLIQDYHFALLPQMIKAKRPDAKVAIFWHIPWPNPESFGICPWRKELLQGMIGADLIGFHTQFHCNNFIESVDRFLESRIDYEHFTINREGRTTWVKPFPISIQFEGNNEIKNNNKITAQDLLKKFNIQAKWMGVGVDRLDYTKGILERFRGIETLLVQHPEFKEQFTFVELGAPSRTMIPKYKEFIDEINKETERINNRFKTKTWQPILMLMKHHSHKEIIPFYKAANLCMVTSLHDGMNLVAKEFISAREDDNGVLILSQFTGAARELRDALIINPYDLNETAEAIKTALQMNEEEQTERMKQMRQIVKENNIYRWAGELVGQLTQVR